MHTPNSLVVHPVLLYAILARSLQGGDTTLQHRGPEVRRAHACTCRYVDSRAENGLTALHMAAALGDLACVKILLGAGASMMVRTVDLDMQSSMQFPAGSTPLHLAAQRGQIAILQAMLQVRAAVLSSPWAVLHVAGALTCPATLALLRQLHCSSIRPLRSMKVGLWFLIMAAVLCSQARAGILCRRVYAARLAC